jgi:hypothetical protein
MSEQEVRDAMAAAHRADEQHQQQGTGRFIPEAHAFQLEGSEARAAQKDPGSMGQPGRRRPMTVEVELGGFRLSAGHVKALLDAERAARQQDEREESEREAARYRAMVLAPIQRAQYQAAREQADLEAARQESLEEHRRQERIAAAQDYAQMRVASGEGKWRTVSEVLEASRSWP